MRTRFTRFSMLPLAACAALVAGCGGGSSSPPTITVSGVAMAGPFSSGNVCAYRASGTTLGTQLACGAIDPATSGYSLNFNDYSGGMVVQVEKGAKYIDEATRANTTLTAPIRSYATIGADTSVRLAVTSLTEAALLSAGNFSDTKITAAAAMLATKFGLGANNLFTNLPLRTPSSAPQLSYRVALDALSRMQAAANVPGGTAQNPSIYLTSLLAMFDGGVMESSFNTARTAAFNAALANSSTVAPGSSCTFSNFVLTCSLTGAGTGTTPTPTPTPTPGTGTGTGTTPGTGTTTPPVAGTSTLTIATSVLGVAAPVVVLKNMPAPTDQASFCNGLTNDATFQSLNANGGSVKINSCTFSNNVGKIDATLSITVPANYTTPYSITYTYS
jgi:hypothetical protein